MSVLCSNTKSTARPRTASSWGIFFMWRPATAYKPGISSSLIISQIPLTFRRRLDLLNQLQLFSSFFGRRTNRHTHPNDPGLLRYPDKKHDSHSGPKGVGENVGHA